jgi:hypothetical protein
MKRRTAPFLAIAALGMLMAACSSPKSNPVTIAITTAPPSSLDMNGTAQIAATVTNDSANKGVDWSCTPAPSCGTFTPAHTASGANTTYQASSTGGTVTIVAASTAQPTVTASATVTVNALTISISTPPPSSLEMNATAQIAATVANDSANKGVDWSCTPVGSCGTFTPAHTASGANTSYQAPNTAGTVTITAASTTNPSVTKSATVTISAITVTITPPPPSSMEINASASIAATVANDLSNGGVTWSCAPTGACGTFTTTQTASGANTVYQAPATAGTVTITAASTTEPTVTASATVTVNPVGSTSSLNGTYTYYANGWDSSPSPYSVVGSVVLDGNGNVTGGEQDYFDLNSSTVDTADPITPATGAVSISADGRGTLTIKPSVLGTTETFSIVLVNNNHLLITEFDSSSTSSGAMDLQTSPTSVPTGGNAYDLYDAGDEFVLGGVITSTGATITSEHFDADLTGTPLLNNTYTSGDTVTAPDASGRGTLTLLGGTQFAYYVVGPEVFRLIEIDGGPYLAGSMYGQGTAAGAFSAASLTGSYAFVQNGEDSNSSAIFEWGAAGEFTTDASSTLTAGVADFNQGDANPVLAASVAGSTYTVGSDGYGSVTLATALDATVQNFGVYMVDPALNIADPNSTTGGGGALMLDLDTNNWGIGFIVPQSSGATFAGNYAFNQDGTYQTAVPSSAFFDLIGQVLSDGSSTLAGNADFNDLGNTGLNPGVTVTGTFKADTGNAGRSTAQLTITGMFGTTTENITLYQATDGLVFHVDMDSPSANNGNTAVGVFEKQQ